MRVKVKICGIRTFEAAEAAINAGADFIGLNFVKSSKRYISVQKAKELVKEIDGKILVVGVFQDTDIEEVNNIAQEVNVDFVQLHGSEDNAYITEVKRPVIKSFALSDKPEIIKAEYVMLDRAKQGQENMVDLEIAAVFARSFPLFLAGGLTPENVAGVVKVVRPYAVDVASGVETNGKQDLEKIRMFVERVRR